MSDSSESPEMADGMSPSLPAVPEDHQPGPGPASPTTQAKKAQSSTGACDACRLRKVRDLSAVPFTLCLLCCRFAVLQMNHPCHPNVRGAREQTENVSTLPTAKHEDGSGQTLG